MKLAWRKPSWLIVYGVLGYLLFLVVQVPAGFVWQQLPAGLTQRVAMNSLQGSAWSATASGVRVNGQVLGNVTWSLHPLVLLTGRVGGAVRVRHPLGKVQAKLALDSGQRLALRDVRGDFNAGLLDPLTRPVMLDGQIVLDLEAVRLQRGTLLEASGTVQWREAGVSGITDLPLGQIRIKAVPDNSGTRLQVSNRDGAIEINGVISVTPNGRYRLDLTLRNRDRKRKDLDTMLAMLGKADATGRVKFRQAGVIPGF